MRTVLYVIIYTHNKVGSNYNKHQGILYSLFISVNHEQYFPTIEIFVKRFIRHVTCIYSMQHTKENVINRENSKFVTMNIKFISLARQNFYLSTLVLRTRETLKIPVSRVK